MPNKKFFIFGKKSTKMRLKFTFFGLLGFPQPLLFHWLIKLDGSVGANRYLFTQSHILYRDFG
jgi:hypothetical protein